MTTEIVRPDVIEGVKADEIPPLSRRERCRQKLGEIIIIAMREEKGIITSDEATRRINEVLDR